MAIKVTLLTHTPNPEQTVAMAAKLCYSPSGIEDIREGLDEEKTSSFIDMLASLGHASPTEHAYFTFGIEGISRACSHQLVRHRIASYSQQSQRYVDGTRFDFVTPPEIAKNEKALAAYEKALKVEADAYKEIRDALAVGYINEKCPDKYSGTDEEIINAYKADDKKSCNAFIKKANEDARFILPNASTTKIVCTFNARSLQNFLHTVAVTERNGKSVKLPSKCFCSVLRLLRTFSKLRSVMPVRTMPRGQYVLRKAKGNASEIRQRKVRYFYYEKQNYCY